MNLVEGGLRRVKSEFGNEAIYGGSYGWASAGRLHHAPSVLKRFFGLFGGYVDKRGNHSFGSAMHIAPYVIGSSSVTLMAVPWVHIAEHTELVVMFGGAHAKTCKSTPVARRCTRRSSGWNVSCARRLSSSTSARPVITLPTC